MQLSEEEKQALREKYKQQRRAMWAGKRTSVTSDESTPEEVIHPETDIPDRHATDDEKHQTHTASSAPTTDSDSDTNVTSQKGATVELADDADSHELHQVEHIGAEVDTPTSDTTRLVEIIREQQEEMWEKQPPIRSRSGKRRRNPEKAQRKSLRESKEERDPTMLTWKLVLGVIGTIIVLIAIGIGLGIWFASQ